MNPCDPRERGVALILVVSILAVISVMVAHMVVVSRISSVESKVLQDRHRLRHDAESAAEWAYWMYACDRRSFPADHRNLLSDAAVSESRGEQEPWLADGRPHGLLLDSGRWKAGAEGGATSLARTASEVTATLRLTDANSGYSLQGKTPQRNIAQQFQDLEENEQLRAFLDRLADYVDADSTTRLDGLEQSDYEGLGIPALPRNNPMELREEILWIPGVLEAFRRGQDRDGLENLLDVFQVLPPLGRSMPGGNKPSLFAAHPNLIRQRLDQGLGQGEAVLAALASAQSQKLPLDAILSPDLLQLVRRHFTTGESGVVIISARARTAGGTSRTVKIVRDCRNSMGKTARRFRFIDSWQTVVQ